jgi:hypothetical protein
LTVAGAVAVILDATGDVISPADLMVLAEASRGRPDLLGCVAPLIDRPDLLAAMAVILAQRCGKLRARIDGLSALGAGRE